MTKNFTIVDSSVWCALFNRNDSTNAQSLMLIKGLKYDEVAISEFIFSEVMTVLRLRAGDKYCQLFINFLEHYQIAIHQAEQKELKLASRYFFKYPKLSFTDATIIATAIIRRKKIITFDKSLKKTWQSINS